MEKSLMVLLAWMPLAGLAQDYLLLKRNHPIPAQAQFHARNASGVVHFKNIPWSVVRIPNQASASNYRKSGLFERCETNRVYRTCAVPNDLLYPQQWGMHKIQAAMAWNIGTINDAVVAVIDTGVDYSHPDIAGNLWTGPNGEHGYTALNGKISIGGRDDHFHGTHVAGIIGAVGNNGLGVAGINWGTKILSLKFLDSQGFGLTMDAALCIDRMIELKKEGHNIRVSNNSWGSFGVDAVLEDAFLAAENAGILNICSAGNNRSNVDTSSFVPAGLTNNGIVSVLASGSDDSLASFSNYGIHGTDLLAPGVAILSTVTNGTYAPLSGTSMAAPHVSGVAAAMFGENHSLTPRQCKAVLLDPSSTDPTGFILNSTLGGRLNFFKCISNPLLYSPPDNHAPTITVTAPSPLFANQSAQASAIVSEPDHDAYRLFVSLKSLEPWALEKLNIRGLSTISLMEAATVALTNAPAAIDCAMSGRFDVSDGRGGSDSEAFQVFLYRDDATFSTLPLPVLRFDSNSTSLTCEIAGMSTGDASWGYTVFPQGTGGFSSFGFYPINTATEVLPGVLSSGANSVRAHVVDKFGNITNSEQLIIRGPVSAPKIQIAIATNRAESPLHVIADMSGTGIGLQYLVRGWMGSDLFTGAVQNPVQSFELETVGVFPALFIAYDPVARIGDSHAAFLTVLPVTKTTMTATRSGTTLGLNWTNPSATDRLEASTDLKGWTTVRAGPPPVTVPLTGSQRFFRVRQQ